MSRRGGKAERHLLGVSRRGGKAERHLVGVTRRGDKAPSPGGVVAGEQDGRYEVGGLSSGVSLLASWMAHLAGGLVAGEQDGTHEQCRTSLPHAGFHQVTRNGLI